MNTFTGIRQKFFRSIASIAVRYAWPIVIGSILLAGLSIYMMLAGIPQLGIKKMVNSGNPNDLLRADAAFHRKYLEYTREFRAEEDYIIVVSSDSFEENRKGVDDIVRLLDEKSDLFKNIFYRIDFKEIAEERGLLFLDTKEILKIENEIQGFIGLLGQDKFSLDLNSLLSMASQKFDPKYMRKTENEAGIESFAEEFVQSLSALADRLEEKQGQPPLRFGDFIAKNSDLSEMQKQQEIHEYLSLEDGKILIVQIPSPNKEASFGGHDQALIPLKEIVAKARLAHPKLEIGLTGEPALSEDEAQASEHDATRSSIITFVLIAGLFWFSFKSFKGPSLALITLLIAVCWTLGFTTLFVGRLNILTITFIPMILGLGIDFGIQILGRYEEEIQRCKNVAEAITQTLLHTGNAIITGASTTAVAFYTMCLNDFVGLSEMGKISGTGILLCVAASLFLLPALLAIRDKNLKTFPEVSSYHSTRKSLFDRIVLDHAWTIIGIATVITVIAAVEMKKVYFDYNLLKLQNEKLESVRTERKLLDTKNSRSVIFAVSISDTLAEAAKKAEAFKKLPSVFEVISLTEIVPKNQDEKLKIIQRIKKALESIQLPELGVKVNVAENIRVLSTLKANCEHMDKLAQKWASKSQKKEAHEFFGRLIPPMARALALLQKMDQKKAEAILSSYQTQIFEELHKELSMLKSQKVDRRITEQDLPSVLQERYIGKNGKILIEIYPKENIWDRGPLERFVKDLRSVDPVVTGTPIQSYEYIELLRASYQEAGRNALIAIVILIMVHFRSIRYVIPTLLPLLLGIAWTVGLMPIIGLPFNPANIITLPLVIGVGVAYGVYAVDRYRENRSPDLFSTSTGKAILLSALTTIFGFGSLACATHRGIASLGLLMTIGVSMCLITSLYVCPAVLYVLGRRKMEIKESPKDGTSN